jgi:hypothetical protein
MPSKRDLEARFWKALKSDMTMMLALAGAEQAHARPMKNSSRNSAAIPNCLSCRLLGIGS